MEQGETQFYGMSAVLARGELLQLRYAAEYQGQWVALVSWAAAGFATAPRP
jgi:hypothetical protein